MTRLREASNVSPRRRAPDRRSPPGRRFLPGAVLAVALALCAPPASFAAPSASSSARPDTVRLATGSVGGTFLPVGLELAAWWERTVPNVAVVVETTAGSVENLDRLTRGEADLAIVGGSPFREVLKGWGNFADEAQAICTVGTLYEDAEQFVVRKSLVRAGNLLDLSGLVMYPGPHQSGGEVDTRRILTALGIEPQFVYVEDRDKGYTAAAQALARGDFDAATFSGGVPIAAVTQLFREHPGEYCILPFSRHMLSRLQFYEKGFDGVVIRAGSYPGLDRDLRSVGGPNLLVARPRLDPAVLAALDRALRKGIATPGAGLRGPEAHPVLQVLDPARWNALSMGKRCPCLEGADLTGSP